MLKQNLSQKQLQKLSPQQIQLMKLLQVPTGQLEQRIKEELEGNPALEVGEKEENPDLDSSADDNTGEDDLDLSDYLSDDDQVADYKLKVNNYSADDEEKSIPIAVQESFHEFLVGQIGMLELNEREEQLVEHLVGSIDDDGYLRRELDSVVDDIAFSRNIETTTEELEGLLKIVQNLEPAGIGARDLQECLLLQIDRKEEEEGSLVVAKQILTKYFDEFVKKHYEKLKTSLKISSEELKEAIDEILKLNPKPGGGHAERDRMHQVVIPDFIIENVGGELNLKLNSRNAPDLRVSNSFMDMMKDYKKSKNKDKEQKQAIMFIKQKIDSAKWFIDAIKQRQHTLLSTMNSIMEYQKEFFLTGDETNIRPMILKDIAEVTGLDISTISRVANSKYVQTEFGTFKLKFFFSESLTTDSGEEVSTREVKKILTDLIASEDKKKPWSDQKLTEFLKEKGYNIARRTVAKYREQLSIPVARLRKEL